MNLIFFFFFFFSFFLVFKFMHTLGREGDVLSPIGSVDEISVSNNHKVTQSVEYLSLPLEFVLKLRRVDFRRLSLWCLRSVFLMHIIINITFCVIKVLIWILSISSVLYYRYSILIIIISIINILLFFLLLFLLCINC